MVEKVREAQQEEIVWEPQLAKDGSPGPQCALIECPADIILYGGARGGGKSDGGLGKWLSHLAEGGPHCNGIIFRLSLTDLEELIERSKAIYGRIGGVYKASKKTWIFPGGARLKFRYLKRLDEIRHYQGHQYTFIWIEEAGDWPTDIEDQTGKPTQKAVKALRATMRSAHGIKCVMLLTANPGGAGHEWLVRFFIDRAAPMEPFQSPPEELGGLCVFIPALLEDNPILMDADPDYEAKLMASGPPHLVAAWRFGDWKIRPTGKIIKIEKFKRYYPGQEPKFLQVWDAWDTAFKEKQGNDFSCGFKFGITQTDVYVLDCFHGKPQYPQLRETIKTFAEGRVPNELLIEDKASGQSVIQELRQTTGLPVVAVQVPPKTDKVERANTITGLIEAGRVWFPFDAPWLMECFREFSIFYTKGAHDDYVDALVIGLRRFLFGMSHKGLMDYYREQVEKLKQEHEEAA